MTKATQESIARTSPLEFELSGLGGALKRSKSGFNKSNLDQAGRILADAVKAGAAGAGARDTIGVLQPDIAARLRTEGPEAQRQKKLAGRDG